MNNGIEIEYLFGGDLIDKTKEATKETGKLTTAAERAASAIHDKIVEQKFIIKDIEADLKAAKAIRKYCTGQSAK